MIPALSAAGSTTIDGLSIGPILILSLSIDCVILSLDGVIVMPKHCGQCGAHHAERCVLKARMAVGWACRTCVSAAWGSCLASIGGLASAALRR